MTSLFSQGHHFPMGHLLPATLALTIMKHPHSLHLLVWKLYRLHDLHTSSLSLNSLSLSQPGFDATSLALLYMLVAILLQLIV